MFICVYDGDSEGGDKCERLDHFAGPSFSGKHIVVKRRLSVFDDVLLAGERVSDGRPEVAEVAEGEESSWWRQERQEHVVQKKE